MLPQLVAKTTAGYRAVKNYPIRNKSMKDITTGRTLIDIESERANECTNVIPLTALRPSRRTSTQNLSGKTRLPGRSNTSASYMNTFSCLKLDNQGIRLTTRAKYRCHSWLRRGKARTITRIVESEPMESLEDTVGRTALCAHSRHLEGQQEQPGIRSHRTELCPQKERNALDGLLTRFWQAFGTRYDISDSGAAPVT